ncbi:MAG: hypothetical protein M3014_15635, partial [Chloroflexota bacterium]|nr:hypothetical protein [Chloroflexota bacterium]
VVSYGTPAEIKAQLIEEYVLVDADDREELRRELGELGFAFTETPQFKIGLDGRTPHTIIKSIDTPLTTLQMHIPTLEDAYLAVVEKT